MINEAANGALATLAEVKVGQDGREVRTPNSRNFQGFATEGHVTRRSATNQAQLLFRRGSNPGLAGGQETEDPGVSIDQGHGN